MVVLEEVNGDGQVTNRLEETVMVKYVRREIRTLTDDEREELLDAVSKKQKATINSQQRVYPVHFSKTATLEHQVKNAPHDPSRC